MTKSLKLKDIVLENDFFSLEEDEGYSDTQKQEFFETVKNFNQFGKAIYNDANLAKIGKTLSELANRAEHFTLQEVDDWFDQVTVKRNMKELKKLAQEFKKTSKDAQSVQDRITALYEDMGTILNRYYSIEDLKNPENNVTESLDGGISILFERGDLKFNPEKVKQLIDNDKYLDYTFNKMTRPKDEEKRLEILFRTQIVGDDDLEKKYKKL